MYKLFIILLTLVIVASCSDIIDTEDNVKKIPGFNEKSFVVLNDTIDLGEISPADTMTKVVKDFIKNASDSVIYIQGSDWDADKNIDFKVMLPASLKSGETLDLRIKIIAYTRGRCTIRYRIFTTAGEFTFVLIFTIK